MKKSPPPDLDLSERAREPALLVWWLGLGLGLGLVGCGGDRIEIWCTPYEEVFVWEDRDGDGFGSERSIGYVCTPGPDEATNNADCDDTHPSIHPLMDELCDDVDNDCDGLIDEGFPRLPWYVDADGDGFGDPHVATEPACAAPPGSWSRLPGDCDDANDMVFPGAIEICNGEIDDDCDGLWDDNDPGVDPTSYTRWRPDEDGDGYGDDKIVIERCRPPSPGAVEQGGDCDDSSGEIHPDALEVCDHEDNDCDGLIDDDDSSVRSGSQALLWADGDGDGYGDPEQPVWSCWERVGYAVANADDCDDQDPVVNIPRDWFVDLDGDGYGSGPPVGFGCLPPGANLAPNDTDCEPLRAAIHPGASEVCDDGIDQDCDDRIDCDDEGCRIEPVCAGPCVDQVVFGALPLVVVGSTTGASDDSTPGCSASAAEDYTLQWVAPADGDYTVDTLGSSFDTVLSLLDGCGGDELDCNDDFGAGLQSRILFEALEGELFLIVVDGYQSDSGSFVLNLR